MSLHTIGEVLAAVKVKVGAAIYHWLERQMATQVRQERDAMGLCVCGNPSGVVLTSDPPMCGSCRRPLYRRGAW